MIEVESSLFINHRTNFLPSFKSISIALALTHLHRTREEEREGGREGGKRGERGGGEG